MTELVPVSVDTPAGTPVVVKIPQDNGATVQARGILWSLPGSSRRGRTVKWPNNELNWFPNEQIFVERESWRPTEWREPFTARYEGGSGKRYEFVYLGDGRHWRRGATRDGLLVNLIDFEPVPVPIPSVVDEVLTELEADLARREDAGNSADERWTFAVARSMVIGVRARLRKEAGR